VAIDAVRRPAFICAIVLIVAAPGCNWTASDLSGRTEEEPPRLSAAVRVADPRTASQLVSGWYQVEENAWRWTAGKFAVLLRPPPGSARTGATLTLHFTLPGVVLSHFNAVTLSATAGSAPLAPEEYTTTGEHAYTREIPASALAASPLRIDFTLDKSVPPGNGDSRELGLIAASVGLETK